MGFLEESGRQAFGCYRAVVNLLLLPTPACDSVPINRELSMVLKPAPREGKVYMEGV